MSFSQQFVFYLNGNLKVVISIVEARCSFFVLLFNNCVIFLMAWKFGFVWREPHKPDFYPFVFFVCFILTSESCDNYRLTSKVHLSDLLHPCKGFYPTKPLVNLYNITVMRYMSPDFVYSLPKYFFN